VSFSPFVRPRGSALPALAVLVAATVGGLMPLARPGALTVGFVALVLLPITALVFAGPARAATITAALAYVAALAWAYPSYMVPTYAYEGLIDAAPAPAALLIVAALAALPVVWLPLSARRPSSIVLWTLWVAGYVPAIVVSLYLEGDLETVLAFDVALLGSMAIVVLMTRLRPAAILAPHLSLTAFTRLLLGLGLLCSVYIAATFGLRLSLPALADVYETRDEFAIALGGGAAGGGYVVFWAGNVINPMMTALGMARKRIDLVTLGVLGQLLIYSVTGFKSTLFSVALVPLVYVVIVGARRSFGVVATLAAAVVLVASVSPSFGSPVSLGLATRTFATTGQVSWAYYDYFSTHPPYNLSHSFLSWLVDSPYHEEPPSVIGAVYFDNASANASYWADAFANFGFAGILGFTLVLGLVLWIADGLGQQRDARVAGPMLAIAGLNLASGALFTTILTGGLALGCALMALMPPASDG